jgi:hypothetical protein
MQKSDECSEHWLRSSNAPEAMRSACSFGRPSGNWREARRGPAMAHNTDLLVETTAKCVEQQSDVRAEQATSQDRTYTFDGEARRALGQVYSLLLNLAAEKEDPDEGHTAPVSTKEVQDG